MKRETVGKIASDLMQKTPDTRDPIELERELHKDYEKNIYLCCDEGKKAHYGDFFITVVTKKETLMKNVLRNMFLHRSSCPTPDYDQTVYHYDKRNDALKFLWVIPSKDTCTLFKDNALEIVESEKELLRYILDFDDGTLYKLAKKFNGEQEVRGGALKEKTHIVMS